MRELVLIYNCHCHPQNKIDYKTIILACKPLILSLLEIIGTCNFLILNFDMKPIMSDNVMWFYAIQLQQIKVFFLCVRFNVIWPRATKLTPTSLYIFSFELCCNLTRVYEVWTSFLVCSIHSNNVIYKCSVQCEMLHYKIVVELKVVLVLVF
jgi:hypothetical protein